jgi:1,4-dihydroxy-6-naphthoate synthase
MKPYTLGYSPCPNDTFIFYAMMHGKVSTGDMSFDEILLDVESLNMKALKRALDLTKVSFHVYGHVNADYIFLRAGGALGRGCGPLLITKEDLSLSGLKGKKIAIPGVHTTAYLLLQLRAPALIRESSSILVMPFHEIIKSVINGSADAGLIIHESRFTYSSFGLRKVIDLGEWWEEETGQLIPLGGIIARRSLGKDLSAINATIRASIEYALSNRSEPMRYIRNHAQELSQDVIEQHINVYVNSFSLDVGDEGERAAQELLTRASEAGIIPEIVGPVFL